MKTADAIVKHLLEEEDDFVKDASEVPRLEPQNDPAPFDVFDRWVDTYGPIKNEAISPEEEAPFDGTMFETFGAELDYVKKANPKHVWTYITGDNNEDVLVAGFHFVNRQGYFITTLPWQDDTEYYVFGEGDEEEVSE